MSASSRSGLVAAALAAAAIFAAGCGKPETPKVDAAAEKAEATKRAKEGAFGDYVKAAEEAKKLQEDANRKAQENLDRIDKATK